MEIFQTIWTALTSENELFTKIIASFFMFVELYVSMLLFTTILNIFATKKQQILYVLTVSIIGLFTLWLIPTPYNTFINILACPILVYFIFKTNILKSVLSEIIPYAIFVLLGSIFVNLYTIIVNIPTESFVNIPIHRLAFSILMYLFAYLIYLFCKNYTINITILDFSDKMNRHILLVNFVVGIIAIYVQSYLTTFYNDYSPLYITVSSVLVLLIYFFISIYGLSRTSKLEVATQNLEEEKLYNKTLTILYDNIRGFKHDFNNIVQAIGGYISTDNMNGLKDYYSDLLEDCQKSNSLSVLNPELINNSAIYSLLTSKYHKADELGIKINLELFLDLSTLNIKTYQLTRILGILLDNAIEASSKCEEKTINIIIRKDNKINRQLFIVENTYLDKNVNIDKIFEKGYTSKTDGNKKSHGLGLWEIRQILNKNNNLNLHTTKDTNLFKQQLEIYTN